MSGIVSRSENKIKIVGDNVLYNNGIISAYYLLPVVNYSVASKGVIESNIEELTTLLSSLLETFKKRSSIKITCLLTYQVLFLELIVILLCNLLLIMNSKVSLWGPTVQYVQDFKDFGLKGKVEVLEKEHLNEPYNGTLTTLFYKETLSNGENFIDYIYVSDVHNGTHGTTLDENAKEEIRSYLENDTEKELFDKVTLEQFEFA